MACWYSKKSYSREEKLFYFSGKVSAFWKNQIFFSDQRNAAGVGFQDLYINEKKASQADLQNLDAVVARVEWDMSPVLHSYVVKYRYQSSEIPPWPYELKGKRLWSAQVAWIGPMPKAVKQLIEKQNVVYMPLTQYSGQLISAFADKFLFGDSQNNVLVHISDFYVNGEDFNCRGGLQNMQQQAPVISAFIVNCEFLACDAYEGPDPHLPTWPVGNYGPCRWQAKFAWVGEMPLEIRQQISRFHVIKMNEWNVFSPTEGSTTVLPKTVDHILESIISTSKNTKEKGNRTDNIWEPLIVTTQTEASIVKGSLLVANHEYGLINSNLDVIVFSVENFYVDGELVVGGEAMDKFFHYRNLSAWIVPLQQPIVVFDIYVMWRAVCVWCGVPPYDMEAIKNNYVKGIINGSVPQALVTAGEKKYTLVLGRITQISFNHGYATAEIGNTTIDILFKSDAVYMKNRQLQKKSNLLHLKEDLEIGIWTLLVFPIPAENGSKVKFAALALWKSQYQHFIANDLIHRILLKGDNSAPRDLLTSYGSKPSGKLEGDDKTRHIAGMIVEITPEYGIVMSNGSNPSYVFFLLTNLYVDGFTPKGKQAYQLDRRRQVNLLACATEHQVIHDYPVTMCATLVWMGRKPLTNSQGSSRIPPGILAKYNSDIVHNTRKSPDCELSGDSLEVDGNTGTKKSLDTGKEHKCEQNGNQKHRKTPHTENKCKGVSSTHSNLNRMENEEYVPVTLEKVPENLKKQRAGKHVMGQILKLMKDSGIALWYCAKKKSEVFVYFMRNSMYVNLCPMDESYSVKKTKPFNFYAVPILPTEIEGYKISLYATCGWDGVRPQDIPTPGRQDLSHISLNNVYGLKVQTGKVVSANVVKLVEDTGIAKWHSTFHGGDIFIEFKKTLVCKNIRSYFDKGIPSNEKKPKPCNFHVIPIEHKELEGYIVSLSAVCGWIGKKPDNFPKFNNRHQPTLFGLKLCARSSPNVLETAALMASRDVQPQQVKSRIEAVSIPNNKDTIPNNIVEPKEQSRSESKIVEEEKMMEICMEGKVVELHSNVGRLLGIDGKHYFFVRENTYLYGVCLNNVELWHVLVQDMTVICRLSEISGGESKVKKVWIGPEHLAIDEATSCINEWCDKHSVPEGTKCILVHQLELDQQILEVGTVTS